LQKQEEIFAHSIKNYVGVLQLYFVCNKVSAILSLRLICAQE